jgi:hypothetical protein
MWRISTGEGSMSEVKAEEKTEQNEARKGKMALSVDELQTIISASVSNALEQSSKIMANAILEARKPYVDPGREENERRQREQSREAYERIRAEIEASYKTCPHLQGSNALSEFQGQLGSFVLHQLDTGVIVGICTNCQKQIWSNNPEDHEYFRRKQANRISRAGQRVFLNPVKAQAAR